MGRVRLIVLVFCYAGFVTSTSPRRCVKRTVDKDVALQSFGIGNDVFSNSFLYEVNEEIDGSNIVSPICVLFILAQLALFTIKESHTQLMNALNLKYKEEIRVVFPVLTKQFSKEKEIDFTLSSKVYSGTSLSRNFKYATKTYFDSEAEDVNFSKPEEAADIINRWVANRTNNLIPKLVSADMFSALTQLVLVNAIHFKANWTKQFQPANTQDRNFYLNNIQRPIKVQTMYQQNTFPYGQSNELDAKIIRLFFRGTSDASLYVLLPNTVEGLKPLLEKMRDSSLLTNALNSLTTKNVQLYLPKFKTKSSIDLTSILPKLNITYIFDAKKSGLTGILKKEQPLHVTSGIQEAVIDLNEFGLEAAAATAIGVSITSVQIDPTDPEEFNADHPFAYVLIYKKYILFAGCFKDQIV